MSVVYLLLAVGVALRKESVDRNLSYAMPSQEVFRVALRKESVDRNITVLGVLLMYNWSLSARRAWIEIVSLYYKEVLYMGRSPQGERG